MILAQNSPKTAKILAREEALFIAMWSEMFSVERVILYIRLI